MWKDEVGEADDMEWTPDTQILGEHATPPDISGPVAM